MSGRLQWWHVPSWFDVSAVGVLAGATVILLWIRAEALIVLVVLGLTGLALAVLRFSSRVVVDERGVSFSGVLLDATHWSWDDVAAIAWEHELRGRFDTVLCLHGDDRPQLLSRHWGPARLVQRLEEVEALVGDRTEVKRPAHLNRFELAKTSASAWWPADPRAGSWSNRPARPAAQND